jgi:apolipoprotein N-acyltransferase
LQLSDSTTAGVIEHPGGEVRKSVAIPEVPESKPALGRVLIQSIVLQTMSIGGMGALIGLPWVYPPAFLAGFIGYVILIVRATARSKTRASLESFAVGFVSLSIAFHWSPNSIYDTTHLSYPVSVLVFLLMVTWESIPFALLGLSARVAANHSHRWLWALVPISIAIEANWPRIFSWSMAYAYFEFPPVLQLAELAGTAGVATCILVATIAIARLWLDRKNRSARFESLVGGLIVSIACGWGWWAKNDWQQRIEASKKLRVAAVQVDPTFVESLGKMQTLSDSVRGKADLLLWPESTLGHYSTSLDHFGDEEFTYANSEVPNPAIDPYPNIHCDLLAGGKTYEPSLRDKGPYKNTAMLINQQYRIVGRYVKRTLMPIGEYVPWEKWFPRLRDWAAVTVELIRGTDDRPLVLSNNTRVGVLVCYEDMVAENASSSVREGAECLVALVNGSAFKDHDTLKQHLALARMRTIENRRSLIRCAATGITCLVHPDGEIHQSLPMSTEGVLLAEVPLIQQTTFYTRHGNWLAKSLTLVSLALVYLSWWKRAPKPVDPLQGPAAKC